MSVSGGDGIDGVDASRRLSGASGTASCLGMDDISAFLNDDMNNEDNDDAPGEATGHMDDCICLMCGTSSASMDPVSPPKTIRFTKKNKDFYCHLVHMLMHGEKVWSVALLRWATQVHSVPCVEWFTYAACVSHPRML